MRIRGYLAFMLGLLHFMHAQAAIPAPASCERVTAVNAQQMYPFETANAGLDALFAAELARQSGIEVSLLPAPDLEQGRVAFNTGQVDVWLGTHLEFAQHGEAWLLEPPVWQTPHYLWFRVSEISDLNALPNLQGLRLVWWPTQMQQGLLTPWLGELDLDNGLEVADRLAAIGAVREGRADFFLDTARELHAAELVADDFEALMVEPVLEPLYIALSGNSACNDEQVRERLQKALQRMNHAEFLEKAVRR